MERHSGRGKTVLLSALLCAACGPVAGSAGTGSDAGNGSTADADSQTSTSVGDATSGASSSGGSATCPAGEAIASGHCFEPLAFDLPGPVVGTRAVDFDIDGDGSREIAIEVMQDGAPTITVWRLDETGHVQLVESVALDADAVDAGYTELLHTTGGYVEAGPGELLIRTQPDGGSFCWVREEEGFACRNIDYWQIPRPSPMLVGRYYPGSLGDVFVVPGQQGTLVSEGIALLAAGPGTFLPASSSAPFPCGDVQALAGADFDQDDVAEVVYRPSVDCFSLDDPDHNLVAMYFPQPQMPQPGVSLDVPVELLLGGDFDHDGVDDVLAAGSDGAAANVRLLHFDGAWSHEPVAAPPSLERLRSGRLRDPERLEAIFAARDQVFLSPSLLDPPVALGPSFGRLLAVGDFDGDLLDDLLVAGSDGPSSVMLLLSR